MQVILTKRAKKYYLSQDKTTRKRLDEGLADLEKEPPQGDIISVLGVADTFRLRIGGYRLLFVIANNIITVTKIQPRGQVYKNL